jgi:hypothetical protein
LQFQQQGKKKFDKFFDKSEIKKIGRSSGFEKRKPNKIDSFHFVLGFLLMCSKSKNTFAEWAIQIGLISNSTVSRQGVWDRVQISASQFAEDLLKRFLLLHSGLGKSRGLFSAFGKVLLQDSTVLNLPVVLANVFAGNTSRGKQKSQVRIQTVINVKCMRFLHFSLSGFTSNDQSASGQIMQYARKGDLVIRDLGYFVSQTFEDMLKAEVHFVSRLKYGLLLKTPSGKAIKLSGLLKKRKLVDMQVLIGVRQLPVRLIMIPLPASVTNERIRKAKCDRDKRINHSEEYYLWLRYSVLITSVGEQVWAPAQIAEVYGVRWQIEIIFKSWKSGAGLHKLLHERVTDANRVKVIIYLFLLFICLFTEKVFNPVKVKIATKTGKELSLIKAINFVTKNLTQVIGSTTNKLWRIMALHCCYDLRTNRRNMADLIDKFKN